MSFRYFLFVCLFLAFLNLIVRRKENEITLENVSQHSKWIVIVLIVLDDGLLCTVVVDCHHTRFTFVQSGSGT